MLKIAHRASDRVGYLPTGCPCFARCSLGDWISTSLSEPIADIELRSLVHLAGDTSCTYCKENTLYSPFIIRVIAANPCVAGRGVHESRGNPNQDFLQDNSATHGTWPLSRRNARLHKLNNRTVVLMASQPPWNGMGAYDRRHNDLFSNRDLWPECCDGRDTDLDSGNRRRRHE